jgi:hypothetical protein
MEEVRTKTEVATIKLMPEHRVAWETAADLETRSQANMFEVAIFHYRRRHEVAIPAATPDAALSRPAARQRPPKNQQEG